MSRATIISAILLAVAVFTARALPSARLEGGPFEPYRFNRATLRSDTPIRGAVEIEGLRWDGSRFPLFRGEADAATLLFEAAFYLDEEFRSVSVRAATGSGPVEFEVDLSSRTGLGAVVSPEEAEIRRVMRSLYPPPRVEMKSFSAAPTLPLEGLSLQTAAFRALALFARPLRAALIVPLAAAAIVSALAAALPRKKAARGRASTLVSLASAAAFAFAVCIAAPGPLLFRAVFPTSDMGLELSGELERRVERKDGCEIVEYGPKAGSSDRISTSGANTGATLLLLPASGGIPLDAVGPGGAPVRFSPPPLVTARGGELFTGAGRIATGWTVYASR